MLQADRASMKSLQGHLLIASPKLLDPNFQGTVVLVIEHTAQGALGVVINRALETTIDEVWSQVSDSPCIVDSPLHQGGPCEGTLMVLHGDQSLSQMQVLSGVYFSTEKETVEQLVAGDEDGRPVKFFVGHSGWGSGQLENELERGDWLTVAADPAHIFETPDDLWDKLRRRISLQNNYPWLAAEMIPDDPTVN